MRIYDALFASGALSKGAKVVDPFGGIGTTGIEGASRGIQVVCCEVEPRFIELAGRNFALHARRWNEAGLPIPTVIQCDSRRLSDYFDAQSIDVVVSSPPYVGISTGAGGLNTRPPKHGSQQAGRSAESPSQTTDSRYGDAAGQLAKMPVGTAPMAAARQSRGTVSDDTDKASALTTKASAFADTFWSAAHRVVSESYKVLKPGGVAVWVVKPFVRRKRIVDFPADWQALCHSVGFRLQREVRAALVSEINTSDLFAPNQRIVVRRERKSFYRRLAEQKGAPPIDYEVVLFMQK